MKVLDENGLSCLKSIIKPKVFEKKKDGHIGGGDDEYGFTHLNTLNVGESAFLHFHYAFSEETTSKSVAPYIAADPGSSIVKISDTPENARYFVIFQGVTGAANGDSTRTESSFGFYSSGDTVATYTDNGSSAPPYDADFFYIRIS